VIAQCISPRISPAGAAVECSFAQAKPAHIDDERNHQGLGDDLIAPAPHAVDRARIRCRDSLGGLLRY